LHAEEFAHLTRFDEQLKDLDKAISKKKDAIADCDVQLTKIDGELKGLEAQRQEASLGHVKNLEKEPESHIWPKPRIAASGHNRNPFFLMTREADLDADLCCGQSLVFSFSLVWVG
jgi:hypothetical protein